MAVKGKSRSKAAKESEMAGAVKGLLAKGMTEDSIRTSVEAALRAAFKKRFGTVDNCVIRFADDLSWVKVFARKVVVDGVYDPSQEIELEEAVELNPDAAVGDELEIEIDPKVEFERAAVSQGKQIAHQGLNENYKDALYNEYKSKLHQVITGYFIKYGRNDTIFVNVGSGLLGKVSADDDEKAVAVEGVLPKKFQSPREVYEKDDRIQAYVTEIKKTNSGIQVVLSRSDPELVKISFENQVPEISDGIVHIYKVVREAGYRAKVAVYSDKIDVDPVGACVGQKGQRIQNVIRALDEKIDVLRYDEDPHVFIANALLPAEINRVVITNPETKEAKAIVSDSQFSIAIGKGGQNVRLANKLCDWNIDVITEAQAAEMDLTESQSRKVAQQLFTDTPEESTDETVQVSTLEGIDPRVAELIKGSQYDDVVAFHDAAADSSINIPGLSQEDIDAVNKIIFENFEFEEEGPAAEEENPQTEVSEDESQEEEGLVEGDEFECPECHSVVQYHLGMTKCPECGVELAFE